MGVPLPDTRGPVSGSVAILHPASVSQMLHMWRFYPCGPRSRTLAALLRFFWDGPPAFSARPPHTVFQCASGQHGLASIFLNDKSGTQSVTQLTTKPVAPEQTSCCSGLWAFRSNELPLRQGAGCARRCPGPKPHGAACRQLCPLARFLGTERRGS